MKKTLSLMVATLFALSAVALADETSGTNTAPSTNGAAVSGAKEVGSSPTVKQAAKKKKKKKKKRHSA